MTWKFVEIWSSTYRHNIHVESTSIRRGVSVGYDQIIKLSRTVFLYLKNAVYNLMSPNLTEIARNF